jgi:hypothetical protein
MRRFVGLALVGVLAAVPAAVRAQTCVGMASFSSGPLRVGGGVGLANSVTNYNVNLNAGSQYGPFGGFSVGRSDFDGNANGATDVGLNGGYSFELNPQRTAKFCPIASFSYQSGPNRDPNIDVSSRALSFGGSFGGLLHTQSTLTLAPFVSASFVDLRRTTRVGTGPSVALSDQYGLFTFGSGFVVNRILTIQPSIAFPVGVNTPAFSDDPVFTIGFGVNFGGAGSATRAAPAPHK